MIPFINIGGRIFPTYGIFMALGLIAGGALAWRRAKKFNRSTDALLVICACAFGFAIVGAKLLYVLVSYDPSEVWSNIKSGDLSFITDGGFVFYGGLIAGIGGAFLGARLAKARIRDYIRIIVPALPLGHAFGRVGCFLAGCCYGVAYDGLFSVSYPNSIAGLSPDISVFPVQLLEAALNLLVCGVLLAFDKKRKSAPEVLALYLILYSAERFFLEFLRGDLSRGILLGLSTSQWISAALFVLGFAALFIGRSKKKRAART